MLSRIPRFLQQIVPVQHQAIRQKYRIRGKPPTEAKSLKQVLDEINYVDPEVALKIDIGLPPNPALKDVGVDRRKYIAERKKDLNLEKKSRHLQLDVSMNEVRKEWNNTEAPHHIRTAAEHYGVFQDLFGDAYFTPYVNLDIAYPQANGLLAPVYRGNVLKPGDATTPPNVQFHSEKNELWTLVLTTPDGNLVEENKECVHWFVGNIPGGDVTKGETIWDYIQPFPPVGVGYQRFVFVLYKQEGRIDYKSLQQSIPCSDLVNRTFDTLEFYRLRQDVLTPCSLAFFQTDWDKTVRELFHGRLNMAEPRFEYDFTPRYINPPKWFAKRQAFNLYLDKYRDKRDIARDYLLKKLGDLHPFETPQKPFPYPNIVKMDRKKTPSWLITEMKRVKLGLGRINQQRNDD